MPESPTLAHLERLLAETYRREIEQEENIWRSLPFFVATLALQLAALFQVVDRLPPFDTWAGRTSLSFIAISALSSLMALSFLAASIYPARFNYMPDDTDLLAYAIGLTADENEPHLGQSDALATFKATLVEQYAEATDHNRRINKRRERRRSVAGLATIAAVLSTLLLVGTAFIHYVPKHATQGTAHGAASGTPVFQG